MTSEAQKQDGWLLPEVITGYDLLCVTLRIPNNDEHRAAFMGAIHMLDTWYNWEKTYTPGDTRASQSAFYWRDLLMTYLSIGDCSDVGIDVRQNEDSPCILEKTYNGGESWVAWANLRLCAPVLVNIGGVVGVQLPDGTIVGTTTGDPNYDGREHAPPPAPRGGSETDNKCLAAANAVNVLVSLHATVMRQIDIPDELSIAAAIAGLLISLLFLPVAVGLIIIAIGGLLTIASELTYGSFDTDTQDQLRCILDCAATDTDGVVTFDFASVQSQVNALSSGLDIWAAISKYLDVVGESGLNLAGATTAITEADCSDCGCNDSCFVPTSDTLAQAACTSTTNHLLFDSEGAYSDVSAPFGQGAFISLADLQPGGVSVGWDVSFSWSGGSPTVFQSATGVNPSTSGACVYDPVDLTPTSGLTQFVPADHAFVWVGWTGDGGVFHVTQICVSVHS